MAIYSNNVINDGSGKTTNSGNSEVTKANIVPTGNINRNATTLAQAYATPSTKSVYANTYLADRVNKSTPSNSSSVSADTLRNIVTSIGAKDNALTNVANEINAKSGKTGGTTETPTYTPVYTTPTYTDYYSQLLDLFTNTNEQARQNQIDAILKNLESVKGSYKNRIQQVMDEYDALINENEVNKYRARKSIRENQANRGQLNSGLGRQEQLQMNMNYDNNANKINTARQNAINEIYNLITQAEAEAESNKATVNNTYANALLQYQLANQ